MDESTPRDRFLQSLNRCNESSNFIPSFYERFLGTSDEIREMFCQTNFQKQNEMLLHSLRLAADAAVGKPEALRDLRSRAESHDRQHLNIQPRLYAIWLSSVIKTASDFDSEWDDTVEVAWNLILGHIIKHMTRHY